jgi:transcriptional/translational regulatory protein YebC/TACO1
MVSEGSVAFMFRQVGEILAEIPRVTRDEIELEIIEAGAEDIVFNDTDSILHVYTKVEDLQTVKDQLEKKNFIIKNAELSYLPSQKTALGSDDQARYDQLIEKLEDHDDVQAIYDNL